MKIKKLLIITSIVFSLSSCDKTVNTSKVKLETQVDSVCYALGTNFITSFQRSSIDDVNFDAFIKGMNDAYEKNELKMEDKEILSCIQSYFAEQRELKLEKNLDDGRAFLAENKNKKGIITTASGLQYEILKEGNGNSPKAADTVVCHYIGTLIDGTVFDSSVEKGKPLTTALNRVYPGWTEGVQLMKEGAKYKFYLPTELGAGTRVRPGGPIEPNMALIFEIELLEVKKGE